MFNNLIKAIVKDGDGGRKEDSLLSVLMCFDIGSTLRNRFLDNFL